MKHWLAAIWVILPAAAVLSGAAVLLILETIPTLFVLSVVAFAFSWSLSFEYINDHGWPWRKK